VLDHLGRPEPHGEGIEAWTEGLSAVAARPNAICKLSAFPARAVDGSFDAQVARECVLRALELFGPERCAYGTDWPVITHLAPYETWLGVVLAVLETASADEREAVLEGTARRTYGFLDR